jgi:uncharacterized membrane protein YbhN (UPF0104 family)
MMFKVYYQDFIHDPVLVVFATVVWRLIFYYSYLLLGVFFLPGVFHSKRERA